jgi:hypothetical protein
VFQFVAHVSKIGDEPIDIVRRVRFDFNNTNTRSYRKPKGTDMPTKTTTPVRQKAEALAAVKAKTTKKATTKGIPVARLTSVWPDSRGKDVPMKAAVTFDGKSWTVKSRFTSRTKEGKLVPSLALAPKAGKGKGRHTPAKAVTLA